MPLSPLHLKLRKLVGQHFSYLSDRWVLVDILETEDTVVLQRLADATPRLQTDQYGQAQRRSAETLCLPISADEGYSEELLLLLNGRE